MSMKLYAAFVPLVAVAAFAVAPAVAQAETKAYGTVKNGVFTAFTATTNVVSTGTKPFILKAANGAIECKSLRDEGTVKNEGGTGHSSLTLWFDECVILPPSPLAGCSVQTPGAEPDHIHGTVTDEVKTETTVEITVTGGFELKTDGSPEGCPANMALGTVTGEATGTEAKGSNELVFTEAPGLFLGEEAATITGADTTVTASRAKEPVLIN